MTRLIRRSIILFSLALVLGVSASESHGQVLSEVLRRMDMYNKSLQSLQANVTMEKENVQLGVKDTSIGTTKYLPKAGKQPMYVRIDWTKPVQEMISVIGDRYELYRPRLKQVIRGTVDKAKNNASAGGALAFMNMSRSQLRANYETQLVGEETVRDGNDGALTWRLMLTPKNRTSYKTAELWVDQNGTPRKVRITEHNGDTTAVLLENIRKNETVKADVFRLNVPSNAVVVGK